MTSATAPAVLISREPLAPDLVQELQPLILANHAATGCPEPADPQWPVFYQIAGEGALCLLVVRIDGRAVGYCAHAAIRNHGTGSLHAVCLAIYLDPAHRDLAKGLVREAERCAREAGCGAISFAVPHLSNAGAFFETVMGYECLELVMGKRL